MMSKVMMADELTNLQDIYLHAVTRHVLLQREADAYLASAKPPAAADPEAGDGGGARGDKGKGEEGGRGGETPKPSGGERHRGSSSAAGADGRRGKKRRGTKREALADRRARLLEVAGRLAPAVVFEDSEGSLKHIRCVVVFADGGGGGGGGGGGDSIVAVVWPNNGPLYWLVYSLFRLSHACTRKE